MSEANESQENQDDFELNDDDFDREEIEPIALSGNEVPVEKIVLSVFFGVSVLMLTIATIAGVITHKTLAKERSAPGRVVDMVLRQSISEVDRTSSGSSDRTSSSTIDKKTRVAQEFYYPVVEFKLPDGQLKTVQIAEGSWPPAYEKGEAVTVAYDAEKPIKARIQTVSGNIMMWLVSIITGTMGLAFLIPVAIIYFISRPQRSKVDL